MTRVLRTGRPGLSGASGGAAISSHAARDYAQMIRESALRRELISLGRDISSRASTVTVSDSAEDQIKEAGTGPRLSSANRAWPNAAFKSFPSGP